MNSNKIYLVRHGENRANLTKELSCRVVDYPLTPKGELQAAQTAEYFRRQEVHAVYASPLKRARQTAEIIAHRLGLRVGVMEAFRELDVGQLEVMDDRQESWRIHDEVIRDWLDGHPESQFPGGEDYFSASGRMRKGIETIMQSRSRQGILVVGHGGLFITSLTDLCPGVDFAAVIQQQIHNCSIGEIDMKLENGIWLGELVRWADHRHLYGEAADVVSGLPGGDGKGG